MSSRFWRQVTAFSVQAGEGSPCARGAANGPWVFADCCLLVSPPSPLGCNHLHVPPPLTHPLAGVAYGMGVGRPLPGAHFVEAAHVTPTALRTAVGPVGPDAGPHRQPVAPAASAQEVWCRRVGGGGGGGGQAMHAKVRVKGGKGTAPGEPGTVQDFPLLGGPPASPPHSLFFIRPPTVKIWADEGPAPRSAQAFCHVSADRGVADVWEALGLGEMGHFSDANTSGGPDWGVGRWVGNGRGVEFRAQALFLPRISGEGALQGSGTPN